LSVPNPALKLKPGMLAEVTIFGGPKREVLLVPSEAVIRTGSRDVVIVADGAGAFRSVPVRVGLEGNGKTEVLEGLAAGQEVVVSGQFLLDSEASLRTGLPRLEGPVRSNDHTGHAASATSGVTPPSQDTTQAPPPAHDAHAGHQ
jgi:Cu(I)/Ag(I) efflux system membrane fusion protein